MSDWSSERSPEWSSSGMSSSTSITSCEYSAMSGGRGVVAGTRTRGSSGLDGGGGKVRGWAGGPPQEAPVVRHPSDVAAFQIEDVAFVADPAHPVPIPAVEIGKDEQGGELAARRV